MESDTSLKPLDCQHVRELPERGSSWGGARLLRDLSFRPLAKYRASLRFAFSSFSFLLSTSNSHIHNLCPPLSRRANNFSREIYTKIQELFSQQFSRPFKPRWPVVTSVRTPVRQPRRSWATSYAARNSLDVYARLADSLDRKTRTPRPAPSRLLTERTLPPS